MMSDESSSESVYRLSSYKTMSWFFLTSMISALPLMGSFVCLSVPSKVTKLCVLMDLNSAIADSGVAKSQRNEVKTPCLDTGKLRSMRQANPMKMGTSVLLPVSGLNFGFLKKMSRVLLGQKS